MSTPVGVVLEKVRAIVDAQAADSATLDGHSATYFATSTRVGTLETLLSGYTSKSSTVMYDYVLTVNSSGGVVTSVSGKKSTRTLYYIGK